MESQPKNIAVTRTARYYQSGAVTAATKRLWIVLHGYGQLASYFIRHFEGLADEATCIVAPEGLSRFYLDGKWDRVGATWMTKEDRLHEIDDYIGYLDAVLAEVQGDARPEVVLLGFSQGTATAWRWLMRGQVRPAHLILWAGGPATDAMSAAATKLADCSLHFVLGDADEYMKIPQAEPMLAEMRKLKPDLKFWTFQGTHRMDAKVLGEIVAGM